MNVKKLTNANKIKLNSVTFGSIVEFNNTYYLVTTVSLTSTLKLVSIESGNALSLDGETLVRFVKGSFVEE